MVKQLPTAIVMNMSYTGLGIARSLGERGVPVIGLSTQHGIYGNSTRYAKVELCADSREKPDQLLAQMVTIGKSLGQRGVVFPTGDHDLVFLDRYRNELEPWFSLVLPDSEVLDTCLNKWRTYLCARENGVLSPQCWLLDGESSLTAAIDDITYPCVLKPLHAHRWRAGQNWELVGARKAIPIFSRDEFLAEYATVSAAGGQLLVQEMIQGADDRIVIAACYYDKNSNWVAGFNTRKLVQIPEGFGTGCIVQAAHCPELLELTRSLLGNLRYSGIAEVEYKWDKIKGAYSLIEINPRPWDQHRLGKACQVELMYIAYCDHAGLPVPEVKPRACSAKWVAEDAFLLNALSMVRHRDPKLKTLFQTASGERLYAISDLSDPLPMISRLARMIPELAGAGMRFLWSALLHGVGRQRTAAPASTLKGSESQGEERV